MSIWNNIGFYICKVIAAPAQGLWVACLITGIGSFTIYYALFHATTFLYNYEEEAKTLRQKKNFQFTLSPPAEENEIEVSQISHLIGQLVSYFGKLTLLTNTR
ncbi:hypothetical protein DICVIV_11935 [Dictyocaulus viviparus]|uniref:Uncharacterized protein n=1 Tax=Dictyocaulus viviparus TaxID=29172 RepID=A0A0D8XE88_DICVI|nr:hypothetical protein DICVIV_11935 [Dictyocaulus viviparus]